MVLWGVVTTCIVAARSVGALMALRALTGVAEAFIHGSLVYLSFWYRYNELATRGAWFDATSALAGAFNGILGHAIQTHLDGANGWRAWRWIFLINGIVPIGWGFVIAALLPSTPESIRMHRVFSPTEKDILIRRSRATHNTGESKIRPQAMLQVLSDPTFWMITGINCAVHLTTGTLTNFLPPILDGLGWEGEQAQLMSSIVYACAFVNIILCARIADKTNTRGLLILANCAIGLLGFVLLLSITNPAARLVATCLLTAAMYPCLMLILVWLAINHPGYSHRTSAFAMTNIAAQLFAILGNTVYTDPPYYRRGLAVSAGMTALAAVLTVGLLWRLRGLNRRKEVEREKGTERWREGKGRSIDEVGNRHPLFMYSF